MKKLMHLIVLSCQKATLLIEKSHNKPLTYFDRIQLKVHLKICDKCSQYQKQSLIIENIIKNTTPNRLFPSNNKLSDTSKIRIQKAMEEKMKNN